MRKAAEPIQGADSHSFLSVFNQASQADIAKTQQTKTGVDTALNDNEAISDEADVELIFAQIGMAENFELKTDVDDGVVGKQLPSDIALLQSDSEVELTAEAQHSLDKSLFVDELAADNALQSHTDDVDITAAITVDTGMTKVADVVDVETYLGSLSTEQLDTLSQFSSLSEPELAALSASEINKLVMGFNQLNADNGQTLPLLLESKTSKQTIELASAEELSSVDNTRVGMVLLIIHKIAVFKH